MNDHSTATAVSLDSPDAPDAPDAVLDAASLDRLRELDPDGRHGVLDRVLGTYEASLGRSHVLLRDRVAAGDITGAGALAHTLKSSSASVGALLLSERCARLERAARDGDAGAVQALAADVLAECSRVAAAVRAMLRG